MSDQPASDGAARRLAFDSVERQATLPTGRVLHEDRTPEEMDQTEVRTAAQSAGGAARRQRNPTGLLPDDRPGLHLLPNCKWPLSRFFGCAKFRCLNRIEP